jgi:hypothetical protein
LCAANVATAQGRAPAAMSPAHLSAGPPADALPQPCPGETLMARFENLVDKDHYPSLWGLLTTSLPVLPRLQPHVFRLFKSYTGLSDSDARQALMYSGPPIIRLTDLPEGTYANFPGSGDLIQLHWVFVANVDAAHRTGFAGPLALLEAKILHEMVHWGWYQVNLSSREPRSKYGYADFAWDFEMEAWGARQTMETTGLWRVLPDSWGRKPAAP